MPLTYVDHIYEGCYKTMNNEIIFITYAANKKQLISQLLYDDKRWCLLGKAMFYDLLSMAEGHQKQSGLV